MKFKNDNCFILKIIISLKHFARLAVLLTVQRLQLRMRYEQLFQTSQKIILQ